MKRISSPIEVLIKEQAAGSKLLEVDYLIVGSGYGGAVAAMRLACDGSDGPARTVAVLERGREYGLGDFPYDIEDIPSHVRILRSDAGSGARGYSDALFNIHVGSVDRDGGHRRPAATDVLVGSGLGGTSLINANVAEQPKAHVFKKPAWPEYFRNTPNPLFAEFDAVREHLGVTTHTGGSAGEFPKYRALCQLGESVDAAARPACIAITTGSERNKVGVQQNPCTDCGNCVTGCNVGAKNTLDRNLLPLAKSRGAQFYTGVTVHTIEPLKHGAYRWLVNVHATAQPSEGMKPDIYQILAHNVILAAGSLGSTEILLRSESRETPQFSTTLGQGFSTNGDGIAMSYAQNKPVSAIAAAEQRQPQRAIGPTITGILQTQHLTIEEAGIPASLARVFSELVTTGAMLQRLSDRKLPDSLKGSEQDPLAASMAVADHCQALLVMGDDGAAGELSLSGQSDRISVSFPTSKHNKALKTADSLLKEQDRGEGLDGGQYVPNPLWQLLPPKASKILGDLPDGRVLTVHPLGGCGMGDDVASGVVNDAGQVFDRDGGVHEGLYVFDGAIIPAALEVNPFLTIAALAWRNAGLILAKAGAVESSRALVTPPYSEVGEVPVRQRQRPGPTEFVIREQLSGALSNAHIVFGKLGSLTPLQHHRLEETDGLVVAVRAACPDALGWLDNPAKSPLEASMELYVNPFTADAVETFHPVGVPAEQLQAHYPQGAFLSLRGTFTLFTEDSHSGISDIWGGVKAVLTYVRRRGWRGLGGVLKGEGDTSSCEDIRGQICTFFNIGILQNRRRRLRYDFESADKAISITGEKVLGYSCGLPRLWDGLFNLDLTVDAGDMRRAHARVTVNSDALLEPGLVAVNESPHLPQSLLFAGGLTAFALRSLVVTNFWEFGGMAYTGKEKQPAPVGNEPEVVPLPDLKTDDGPVPAHTDVLPVPIRPGCKPEHYLNLQLHNFRREGAQPVLLLHGLAQGSEIFWTQGITNMARYFYEQNFDVWLLDYRLSNRVLPYLTDQAWSIDEIARFDIPLAIDAVYTATGGQKVAIFAHCVGACALAMAVLSDRGLSAKIHAAVTNAIHPWVMPSPGNRFRGKLGNVSRDWITDDLLDPVPRKEDTAVHRLIDRLAFSLARMREVGDDHVCYGGSALANSICDRMTFLYGRMWNHENLHHTTHASFEQMLGPSPARVYQHLYYFTRLRRITSEEGENIYLERRNIEQNWNIDILFVHGGDSLVFNPHSARRSAKRLSHYLQQRSGEDAPVIGYQIYDGYGHMDVVFGKDAHRNCFPDYLAFLRQPSAVNDPINADDWPESHREKPLIGPILRAAWHEDGRIHLRYTAELRGDTIDPPVGLVVSGEGVQGVDRGVVLPFPHVQPRPHYQFVDVQSAPASREIALQICSEFPDLDVSSGAALRYRDEAWFTRFWQRAADAGKHLCFLVGSCRFPGSIIDNALSEEVYSAMREHIAGPAGAHLLFLVGDQIYADATDQLFEVDSLNSRFTDRYRRAFGAVDSPHFSALVRQVPTHFALDDHEFDDNFSGLHEGASLNEQKRWQYAREMAACYMSSVRNQVAVGPAGTPTLNSPFYYPLACPGESDFPVFVTDTRSQRQLRHHGKTTGYQLVDDPQLRALIDWLQQAADSAPDSPKFIVSGSIVAPLPVAYCEEGATWRRLDGWAGYPATLEVVLDCIVANGIRHVFFIGGDAHLSALAKLRLESPGHAPVDVWQIVSSGLYAPMPFANSHVEDYRWDVAHAVPVHVKTDLSITCTNTLLSDAYSQFVQVDASDSAVRVICRDHLNNELAQRCIEL